MMAKMTIKDVDVRDKTVFMRVDFNVPMEDGRITDNNRIVQAVPTIDDLISSGAKVVLASHLGRPKGKPTPEYSLKPVAEELSTLVDCPVHFAADCIGSAAEAAVAGAKSGDVVLLENLRFHSEEEANDDDFSRRLASLADLYVNDAFGSSHRAHASVEGITHHLQPAVSGYLLEREIRYLDQSVNHPERPFTAILGGAKVSDKIGVIENLLDKVDVLLIGGGMSFTFYKAMGLPIGNSLVETDRIGLAADLIGKAKEKRVELLLPIDSVVADRFAADATTKLVGRDGIQDGWMALDIGPETVKLYSDRILASKTVLWNGPMGVFEMEPFARGTFQVARALAEATSNGAVTIVGGGDSAAAIKEAGLEEQISHVSTGGGASLEYLEGKPLPGVESLTNRV